MSDRKQKEEGGGNEQISNQGNLVLIKYRVTWGNPYQTRSVYVQCTKIGTEIVCTEGARDGGVHQNCHTPRVVQVADNTKGKARW